MRDLWLHKIHLEMLLPRENMFDETGHSNFDVSHSHSVHYGHSNIDTSKPSNAEIFLLLTSFQHNDKKRHPNVTPFTVVNFEETMHTEHV